MLNQTILVGRLTENPTLKKGENITELKLNLAIPRSFKNAEGEYETDFIPCLAFGTIAENTCEYCKKGDVIGVRGRLEMKSNGIVVIAEKVTFLSSTRN